MDWKPGAAWPFRPGGSAEPHAMQLPASVRQVIDPTYWDNTSPVPIDVAAGTLLRQYIPDISNFIQRQRQAYSLGSADYHRMRGTAPQLLVDYINNSGQEIITVTLQPTTTSSSTSQMSTFIAIDNGNDNGYAYPDDQGNNYPGGFNVYGSSDGITWNIIARLGAVTMNPNSIEATGFVASSEFLVGEVTTNFVGFNSFGGASVIGPASGAPAWVDLGDTLPTPDGTTTNPSSYPQFFSPITYSDSGLLVGYNEILEVTGPAPGGLNTDGPLNALNALPAYVVSGNGVFVIAGAATNDSFQSIPLYWRSSSSPSSPGGLSWVPFVPPFTPTVGWFPNENDVWFDDGSQRTMTGNQFDGQPTLLWFSSNSTSGTAVSPLYVSADGCKTWKVSTSHTLGLNGSNKTDGVCVGNGNTAYYGEIGSSNNSINVTNTPSWKACYGDVTGGRMGVQIQSADASTGVIHAGPAVDGGGAPIDPSTWPAVLLPTPANAVAFAAAGSAQDLLLYDDELENEENILAGLVRTLDIEQARLAFFEAYNGTYVPGAVAPGNTIDLSANITAETTVVADDEAAVAAQEAVIAGFSPPAARQSNIAADWVAYSSKNGGIFVVVGHSRQSIDYLNVPQQNDLIPLIWWSKDTIAWNVATPGTATPLGVSFANAIANFNWTSFMQGIVCGNAADQILPIIPT